MVLQIRSTTDGRAIAEDAQTTVTLTPDEAGVTVVVDAPHYADPLPDAEPGPVWGLWEYEVVELFVAGPGDPVPYLEVELGPGGHHLVLRLRGVRQVMARKLPLTPVVMTENGRWTATVHLPIVYLPPKPWRVNATAIHGQGSERTYLTAAPLPGETPDFHQPDAFLPFED